MNTLLTEMRLSLIELRLGLDGALNMSDAVAQLADWTESLTVPRSTWISGLFNSQAFLTAIKQSTARAKGLPLDQMDLLTDITKMTNPTIAEPMPEGCLMHGFVLEGARWDSEEGVLAESFLKELHPVVPIMHAYALQTPALAKRMEGAFYECPAYVTTARGGTYIFPATMAMAEGHKPSKWILAGVALIMQ